MEDKAIYRTNDEEENLEEIDCFQTLMMLRLDYSPEVFARAIRRLYKAIAKDF